VPRSLIVGLSGPALTSEEAAFLRRTSPCGIILFARNVKTPQLLRKLIDDATTEIGSHRALVLVDQEGGRVQRLRPPHWRALPAAAKYDTLGAGAAPAAHAVAQLTARDLRACGINTNCVPCADLAIEGADAIIGDRAYAAHQDRVAELAGAVAQGHLAAGVLPVLKHIPGHGRAGADSHLALPVVETPRQELECTDFSAFRQLAALPAAMTAHVVYSDIDPEKPATVSSKIIAEIIRHAIGFDGLLITDDLSMRALSGTLAERSRASLAAGCDILLHCNGVLDEMEEVAGAATALEGTSLERFERCTSLVAAALEPLQAEVVETAEHALMQLGLGPFTVETS
jgi:beta-N-acetylhexosaminidase